MLATTEVWATWCSGAATFAILEPDGGLGCNASLDVARPMVVLCVDASSFLKAPSRVFFSFGVFPV